MLPVLRGRYDGGTYIARSACGAQSHRFRLRAVYLADLRVAICFLRRSLMICESVTPSSPANPTGSASTSAPRHIGRLGLESDS